MKKKYEKPIVWIEEFCLDAPISLNCIADKEDMESLIDIGYFIDVSECLIQYDDGMFEDSHDTICYHSNVQQAFLS